MASEWENVFQGWAQPPSSTEQTKCENAESVIKNAVNTHSAFDSRNLRVFAQGSYRNRTNVRADSDVDICVMCRDTFFYDLPDGMIPSDFGITPAGYSYAEYKSDVGAALVSYLGRGAVTRGNKAFNVHENTYHVDADVVACFEYRWYQTDRTYLEGTAFFPDNGVRVINWPEQHYNNGVRKNDATGRRYKAIVRVLKCLRNEMADNGHTDVVPSYLIECLVWNVPNDGFGHNTYTDDIRYALAYLFNNTLSLDHCKEWGEVNEFKYLFRTSQPWTYQQANKFLLAAWNYVGFR